MNQDYFLILGETLVIKICRMDVTIVREALNDSGGKFLKKRYTETCLANSLLMNFRESQFNFYPSLNNHLLNNLLLKNHL